MSLGVPLDPSRAAALPALGVVLALLASGCTSPPASADGLPRFTAEDVPAWDDEAWFASDLRHCVQGGCREGSLVLGRNGTAAVIVRVLPPPDNSTWGCGAQEAFAQAAQLGATAQCLGVSRVARIPAEDWPAVRAHVESVLAKADPERREAERACLACGHLVANAWTREGRWRHAVDAATDTRLTELLVGLHDRLDPPGTTAAGGATQTGPGTATTMSSGL